MATKKKYRKLLTAFADELPAITSLTHENHIVKGDELLEQGQYETPDGKKVIADITYTQAMPVVIMKRIDKGIKRAFAKRGQQGVADYLKQMRRIVEQN